MNNDNAFNNNPETFPNSNPDQNSNPNPSYNPNLNQNYPRNPYQRNNPYIANQPVSQYPQSNLSMPFGYYAEPAPTMGKPKSHGLAIVIVALAIIVTAGISIAIWFMRPTSDPGGSQGQNEGGSSNNNTGITKFEDLTKEEAIAYLKTPIVGKGRTPKDYVPKELTDAIITEPNPLSIHIISDLELVYSYDTLDDLKSIADDEYRPYSWSKSDESEIPTYTIKEYGYYAIVTPDRIKEDSTQCDHGYNRDCDSLLSFKSDYIDYHQEVTNNDFGGKSYNSVYLMKTTDKETISQILRIYTLFSSVGLSTGPGTVYSYDFEENDDQYVLTVNNIGVGYNSEMMKNPEAYSQYTDEEDWLALNLYRRYFVAEKETGEVYVKKNDSDGVMFNYKSIQLTKEEYLSLMYGDED